MFPPLPFAAVKPGGGSALRACVARMYTLTLVDVLEIVNDLHCFSAYALGTSDGGPAGFRWADVYALRRTCRRIRSVFLLRCRVDSFVVWDLHVPRRPVCLAWEPIGMGLSTYLQLFVIKSKLQVTCPASVSKSCILRRQRQGMLTHHLRTPMSTRCDRTKVHRASSHKEPR